jgi:hypothetical protein
VPLNFPSRIGVYTPLLFLIQNFVFQLSSLLVQKSNKRRTTDVVNDISGVRVFAYGEGGWG